MLGQAPFACKRNYFSSQRQGLTKDARSVRVRMQRLPLWNTMSWRSGSKLFNEIWPSMQPNIPNRAIMQQTTFPFRYAPDAFFMALPKGSACLLLKAFETSWGSTDEVLCYWNGVLFGQSVPGGSGRIVTLLPTLDRQRGYPWPSAEGFSETIVSIFSQFPSLEVWCERDCEQYPVESAGSVEKLLEYMEQVSSFCQGDLDECPSFSYCPDGPTIFNRAC